MGSTIIPAGFELEFDLSVTGDFEAFVRERAAGDVFNQFFETVSGLGIYCSVTVEREAVDTVAAFAFC